MMDIINGARKWKIRDATETTRFVSELHPLQCIIILCIKLIYFCVIIVAYSLIDRADRRHQHYIFETQYFTRILCVFYFSVHCDVRFLRYTNARTYLLTYEKTLPKQIVHEATSRLLILHCKDIDIQRN